MKSCHCAFSLDGLRLPTGELSTVVIDKWMKSILNGVEDIPIARVWLGKGTQATKLRKELTQEKKGQRRKQWKPFSCRECKHRLACLVKPERKVIYERIEDGIKS